MTLIQKINDLTWFDLINKLKNILKNLDNKPAGGGTLGLIRIVDKNAEFFNDLASANTYIRTFTNAVITDESYNSGVYYFTVPNGSDFSLEYDFLLGGGAYIEDSIGLINAFSVSAFELNSGNNILGNCTFGQGSFGNSSGNNTLGNCTFGNSAFDSSTGNNILGNCTFGVSAFESSSGNNILGNCTFGHDSFVGASGINKFKNILLTNPTDSFADSATGRFEIYGNIGTTEAANYTNFFATSNATIWVDKSKETINGGGIEGDLALAETNGATLFFGY